MIDHETNGNAAEAAGQHFGRAERFRMYFEQMTTPVFVHDFSGRFVDVNPAACASLGYRRAELLDKTVFDVALDFDMTSAQAEWKRMRPGRSAVLLGQQRRKDAFTFPVELRYSVVEIQGERLYMAEAIDITERSLHERTQATLAAIVQNSNEAIVGRGRDGRIISWNPAAERILGYTAAEVVGTDLQAIFTPEDRQLARENRAHIAARRTIPEREGVRITRDGRRIDVSVSLSPIRAGDGRLIGTAVILRDITEGKRYERTQATFAAIVENMGEAVIGRNRDGKVISWNRAAEHLLGYTAAEAIGTEALDIFPREDPALWRTHHTEILATGTVFAREAVRIAKDGTRRFVSIKSTPIKDGTGYVVGSATIMRDIGDRMRMRAEREASRQLLEQRVAERTAELSRARDKLRALLRQLNTAEERERRAMAMELHDNISQLLAGANMMVHSQLSADLPPACSGVLLRAAGHIDQAQQALRSLNFQISPPVLSGVGLVAALEWLSDELRSLYGLVVDIRAEAVPHNMTQMARSVLYRATRELLINVAKHSGVRAAHLDLRTENEALRVSVADSGIGFDRKEVETRPAGSGFGLFSMSERLLLLGGNFEVHSHPGEGTAVTLIVPLAAATEASDAD